jgi:aspartyl-tRNA(Asn)/glutamyl-tRNA(Gln) amidotransferase subunit A
MSDSVCWMSAQELREAYDRGALSPREVCVALSTRVKELDSSIGAFSALNLDRALRDAEACTQELARGFRRGPLHGIPVAIKELFDVEGACTTFGSMLFRDRVAPRDAEVVRRLRSAGAIIVGLTRSHEFGWGITTQHAQLGGTHNPWDYCRVPGGSSGGSAAAVATGMVPIALASDTGGSIRIPAGYCGVAGLKPSYGRVSKVGAVPLAPSLDHPGFISRDVSDLAMVFSAVAGYDPEDATTSAAPIPSFEHLNSGLSDLRIGLAPTLHHPPLRADHEAVFRSLIDGISKARGVLTEVHLPAAAEIRPTFDIIQRAEAYHVHTHFLGTFPARADEYGADVRSRLEMAAQVKLSQYLEARQMAARIRRQFEMVLAGVDVLLTPITAGGPSSTAQPDVVEYLGAKIPFRDLVMDYTVPQDVTGLPACAVRAGFDQDGVPVGVQVTAPHGREDLALRVARCIEEMLGGFKAPPRPPSLGKNAEFNHARRFGKEESSLQDKPSML